MSAGDIIRITQDVIESDAIARDIRCDTSGALASFVGVVRNHHEGNAVHHLVYEAYPPMAEKEMMKIAGEMHERWKVDRVAIVHRTGRLEVGESSVVIVVSAPHRHEAIEACSYGIERLKERVPIWKKEFGEKGEEWIVGDSSKPPQPPRR